MSREMDPRDAAEWKAYREWWRKPKPAVIVGKDYPMSTMFVATSDDGSRWVQEEDHEACLQAEEREKADLIKALKELTFCARTTGVVAGPDPELLRACEYAEKLLVFHDAAGPAGPSPCPDPSHAR